MVPFWGCVHTGPVQERYRHRCAWVQKGTVSVPMVSVYGINSIDTVPFLYC